jgi:hypothetical protein
MEFTYLEPKRVFPPGAVHLALEFGASVGRSGNSSGGEVKTESIEAVDWGTIGFEVVEVRDSKLGLEGRGMNTYRVTLTGSGTPTGGVTHDGHFGKLVRFGILDLHTGKHYSYEGSGGGHIFEARCARLSQAGSCELQAPPFEGAVPDTEWKERLINEALKLYGA